MVAVSRRTDRADTLTDAELPEALDLLTSDADWEVRLGIVSVLRGRHEPEVVDALVERLGADEDALVRREAALTLGVNREGRGVAALVEAATNDPDDRVRVRAVEALGRLRASEGVPAMIALSRHPASGARYRAVIALGQVMDPHSIGALAERLDDRLSIAYFAAWCLGGFKAEEAKAAFERSPRRRVAEWSFRRS
jgi:HEAT repeat protein